MQYPYLLSRMVPACVLWHAVMLLKVSVIGVSAAQRVWWVGVAMLLCVSEIMMVEVGSSVSVPGGRRHLLRGQRGH